MASFGNGSGRRSKLTYGDRRRGSGSALKAGEATAPAWDPDEVVETPQAKRVKGQGSDGKAKGKAPAGLESHGTVSDDDVVVQQRRPAPAKTSPGKAAAGPARKLGKSKATTSKADSGSDRSLTDYDEDDVALLAGARSHGLVARKAAASKAAKIKRASPAASNKPPKKTKLSPSAQLASASLAPAVELSSHRASPPKSAAPSAAHSPSPSSRGQKRKANAFRPRTPPPASRPVTRPATPIFPSGSTPAPVTPKAQQGRPSPSPRASGAPRAPPADLSDIFATIVEPSKPDASADESKPRQSRIAQMGSRSNTKPTVSASPSLSSLGSATPRRTAGLGMTHSASELGSPSLSHVSRSPTRSILGSPSRSLSRNASGAELGGAVLVPPVTLDLGVLSGASNGRTRTYGGLQRSFLPDEDDLVLARDEAEIQGTQIDDVAKGRPSKRFSALVQPKARESYADLRRKWGIDQDDEDPDQAVGSSFDLRTLAQQRTSGSSKRFLDELSYLFEGLSPDEDLSSRRSSAVQLSRHLLDADFLRRLRVHGLLERVYEALRAARGHAIDKTVQACLAFFVATLCLEQRLAEPVLRMPPVVEPGEEQDPLTTDSDCLRVLGAMLDSPRASDDLAKEHGVKMITGKKMAELAEIVGKSNLREHVKARLSLSSLVLFSLAAVSTFDVRPGLRPQQAVVKSGALSRVAEFLARILSRLDDRIGGFSRGMDLLPVDFDADLQALDFCVSVVETCTTCDEGALLILGSMSGTLASGFISLLTVCTVLVARVEHPAKATLALNVLTGSLRGLINVTNVSEAWLDRLCDARVVKTVSNLLDICRTKGAGLVDGSSSAMSSDGLAFDTLCVALALLANIAEHGEPGRRLLLDTKLGPSCSPLDRKCVEACACENAASALGSIIRLYADPLDFCPTAEEKQFVKAYGGALLTLAMVDDEDAQSLVVRGLAEAGRTEVDELVDSIGELAGQQEAESQGDEAKLRRLQASLRAKWEEGRA